MSTRHRQAPRQQARCRPLLPRAPTRRRIHVPSRCCQSRTANLSPAAACIRTLRRHRNWDRVLLSLLRASQRGVSRVFAPPTCARRGLRKEKLCQAPGPGGQVKTVFTTRSRCHAATGWLRERVGERQCGLVCAARSGETLDGSGGAQAECASCCGGLRPGENAARKTAVKARRGLASGSSCAKGSTKRRPTVRSGIHDPAGNWERG
jgi:hypothetical protein